MTTADTTDRAVEANELQRFLGLTAGLLSRNIVWSLTRRTERYGVMPGAFAVIAWLTQLHDTNQAELSRLVGIEQSTMALTLRRMERDSLVEFKLSPDHGRRKRISLSARGRALSERLREGASAVEAVATRGLTEADIADFHRVAAIMSANLALDRLNSMEESAIEDDPSDD